MPLHIHKQKPKRPKRSWELWTSCFCICKIITINEVSNSPKQMIYFHIKMRLSVPVVLYRFLQNILTNLVIFSCMLCLMCIHKRRILVSEGILGKGALLMMGISCSFLMKQNTTCRRPRKCSRRGRMHICKLWVKINGYDASPNKLVLCKMYTSAVFELSNYSIEQKMRSCLIEVKLLKNLKDYMYIC